MVNPKKEPIWMILVEIFQDMEHCGYAVEGLDVLLPLFGRQLISRRSH
jgi:hypothetical protein